MSVPNSGYATSCLLAAVRVHLSSRDQPDTLAARFKYPARTSLGPAVIVIEDVKLGRSQLSTLHLALWQGGLKAEVPWITPSVLRRAILAHTTHTNLQTFGGFSLSTGDESTPAAALPDPFPDFEAGPLTPGVLNMWIRTVSGEHMTQAIFPYLLAAPELRELLMPPSHNSDSKTSSNVVDKTSGTEDCDEDGQAEARASLWFPTIVVNLEVKTALPEEGVEWLNVGVTSKDVEGEIIALSYHIALVLSIERNTAKTKSPL
ncbi:thioesterase-like superfamily-domain-containing protein [Xylaria telfairii]|nr:thioesterase-like superfamily-domain-containing protein [Xylaria telfairii]